jgi:hypothetical protein
MVAFLATLSYLLPVVFFFRNLYIVLLLCFEKCYHKPRKAVYKSHIS